MYYSSINTKGLVFITTVFVCIWLIEWIQAQTTPKSVETQQLRSGVTSNRVLMDAIGSTGIRVAWWTEDVSRVLRYSISCYKSWTSKQHMLTGIGHIQNITVSNFMDQSINSVTIDRLMPSSRYKCCLVEHHVNSTYTAEVCQYAITLTSITQVNHLASKDCSHDSYVGATVSLFVMLLLALICTLLLTLIVIKQGKDGEKVTHWYELVKNQNESLTRRLTDAAPIDEAATANSYKNSAALSADDTEEGMPHSPIVTSECVAYSCAVIKNPSQTSESVDSVVYDYPFST